MPHGSMAGNRKPDGVCLRRAFRDGVVSYESKRCAHLLEQGHPFSLGIPAAAGDVIRR